MTGWWEGPMLAFDVESTGVDVWTDRVVTAALIDVRAGTRPKVDTWLFKQDMEIPAEAVAIHGVSTEHANAHGVEPGQALFEITGRLALAMARGVPIVAFNAAFDLTMLEAENLRHGVDTLGARLPGGRYGVVIDPFVIDKKYSRRKGSRKLVDTCTHYGVRWSAVGAHDAGADALATCRLVPRLVAAYPELGAMLPAHLHALQVRWRAEQMSSLRSYFTRVGKDHDGCDGGWPLRTDAPAVVTA